MENVNNRLTIRFVGASMLLGILFALISCSQSKQDSGQTQQVRQPNQEIPTPESRRPAQPVTAKSAEQPSTAQTQPELNPPHGQPYHRCDIPVGAPLNGSPTTGQTTNQPLQVTTSQPSASAPAAANRPIAPTVQSESKPRLNPPHGQPYHRCDIAVGSPLP